jgi:serine/threonine protein kinase
MGNLAGAMLSDYLLLECLSQGNVADVYRARQNDEGQYEVAVKIFGSVYAEREAFHACFMDEAEKIGHFDHPHILPFVEYGEGQGLLYSVTPFVKSGTLDNLVKKVGGKFPAMQALPIVQQLCDAVHYAHEHDVVHGNIKPGNIFVANDGRMLLADFGIARSYLATQALSQLEWGPTEYAAPEQSLGLLRPSSDIYALGALFFHLLTGVPLFTGQTSLEVLFKHVRQEPPSARSLEPSISDAVDDVLYKALRKRADERYATAAELSQAFAAAVAVAPVASPVARTVGIPPARPVPSPVPNPPSPARISFPFQAGLTSAVLLPPEMVVVPVAPTSQLTWPEPANTLQDQSPVKNGRLEQSANFQPVELVEWSPSFRSGEGIAAADPAVAPGRVFQTPRSPAPAPPAESVAAVAVLPAEEHPKRKLLLPVLVVILLILGLLGALLSSFLLPASPGGSGWRNSSVHVAYQAHARSL